MLITREIATVAANFWFKSESIPITLEEIAAMSDESARQYLAQLRWGATGEQICPACAVIDKHHNIRTRQQWRCKHCYSTFSVTTGTPFADHKIGYRKLLLAIFAFIINQKGLAALALRRIIGGQYRTSFTLLHKIREAMMISVPGDQLSGKVEIDGGHFSGRPRKGRAIKKPKPEDKTQVPAKYSQHRTKTKAYDFPHHPNRRIVMAIRELDPNAGEIDPRTGKPKGRGASRTLVAICRSENAKDIEALVNRHVAKHSTIVSDELSAYGNLKYMGYLHETVNHSKEFSTTAGVNQNQAEAFFSRMRRACIGIYHRVTPRYMLDYASEMAWREDWRRKDTGQQLHSLVRRVFGAGVSADWMNYCRGNKRQAELIFQG